MSLLQMSNCVLNLDDPMGRDPAAHRGELQPRHSPSSPPLRAGLLLPRRRLHLPPLDRL